MAIEEVGANPERLADAIHVQLGERPGPVPVAEIAKALDIVEIRAEPLSNIEGALVTTPERDIGSILVNQHSSRRRRRFTIGHELLHFLNAWHQPTLCNQADMIANQSDSKNRDPSGSRGQHFCDRAACAAEASRTLPSGRP